MAVCRISVHSQKRYGADKLQALTHYVAQADIICHIVIAVKGENTPLERIHHVLAGRLHNDVPHKVGR